MAAQELNESKRQELYARVQVLAIENLPFIHLVNPLSMVAVRNTVKGVRPSALKGVLWNIDEIRLEEK